MSSPMTDSSQIASDDQVGTPLRRAMSMPLLSADEERRLPIRIQQGDQAAKQRMIESNLRLVFSLARTYRGRGVPMADLVQEGTIGLAQAVERFDHRHEVRFSTYAAWWIRGSLRDAVSTGIKALQPASTCASARCIIALMSACPMLVRALAAAGFCAPISVSI